ncbi:TPA: MFS transporter [Klebsiella pneumoniae]|nr:MFS transporter [Klebsiella pneumoniae]
MNQNDKLLFKENIISDVKKYRLSGIIMLGALIALAMNLRSPITAVPAVITSIRHDLGLTPTFISLLTSIPVFCFGVLTPVASALILRLGIQKSIYFTLIGAAVGLALRPYTGVTGLLIGTFIIGCALAVGNIVSLMIIARDFRHRMKGVTGLYTASINIGTMLTSSLTALIAVYTGWQFALAIWFVFPLVALLLSWTASQVSQNHLPEETSTHHAEAVVGTSDTSQKNQKVIWILALAFFIHLFIYYGITAWLPAYLTANNAMSSTQAGVVASAFQVLSMLGAFGVPLLARKNHLGKHLAVMGVLWAVSILWMLYFPHQWIVWTVIAGVAQGGCFVVIFMLIMQYAVNLDHNRKISTAVQGLGYTFASTGPIVVGYLHDISGGWTLSWSGLALSGLVLTLAGMVLMRIPIRKP